jgi:MFS family permease
VRDYYGWKLVVVLGVITIVTYGTSQYLFGLLVVPASQELHVSRAEVSSAYSAGLVVAALLALPVGRIVDRQGARWVLCVGSTIAAVSLLGLSRAGGIALFYALWAGGIGVAMALTLYPVTFVVVANWFARRRGSAMAVLTTIGGLSSPLFVPFSGWLIATLGWRGALPLLALTQVAMLPLQLAFVRRRPEDLGLRPDGVGSEAPPEEGPSAAGATARTAARTPAFWLQTLAGSAGLFAAFALQVHQVPYMIAEGLDPVVAASIAGSMGLVSIPGRFVLNVLSQRIAGHALLALAFALMTAAIVVLLFARSIALFTTYAVLYGVGYGAVNPLRASVMADHFGRRAFGAITGVQNVPVILCSAGGPVLVGRLFDLVGNYRPALLCLTAAGVVAVLATAATPAPRSVPARPMSPTGV